MAVTASTSIESRWDAARTGADELDALVYRSNLLASDRSVVNFGGGNTSVKVSQVDHTGRTTEVLWVKGSGSDLATIDRSGFTGLRLDEILPLAERPAMSDEEMVAYLARCQLDPSMPRPSIETLLHAFIPHPHVDHTHPDAIGAIVGATDGERLAEECFGTDAVWIPYIRPGFALSKLVAEAVASSPNAGIVLLAKHGLVTWGATAAESYAATLDAINRAAAFVEERRSAPSRSAGPRARRSSTISAWRCWPRSCRPFAAPCRSTGRACFRSTSRRPCWSSSPAAIRASSPRSALRALTISFTPSGGPPGSSSIRSATTLRGLRDRLVEQVGLFHEREHAYFEQYRAAGDTLLDPSPRVVLIEGVGLVSAGRTLKAAKLARDLYLRAIAVMRGASALGGFVSLDDEESYAIEYWPLELYKLSLAPAPREFQGAVVLITGGAGGIGSAAARAFAAEGACVVLADLDGEGAGEVAAELGEAAVAVAADVTDESSIVNAYREAALAFGGVDVVVSNAGIASSAPILETSLRALGSQQRHPGPRLLPGRQGGGAAARRAGHRRQHRLHRVEERPCSRERSAPPTRPPRPRSSTSRAASPRSSAVTGSA